MNKHPRQSKVLIAAQESSNRNYACDLWTGDFARRMPLAVVRFNGEAAYVGNVIQRIHGEWVIYESDATGFKSEEVFHNPHEVEAWMREIEPDLRKWRMHRVYSRARWWTF